MKLLYSTIIMACALNFSAAQSQKNAAMEEYRTAQRNGEMIREIQWGGSPGPTPTAETGGKVQVDLSETNTEYQISIDLEEGKTEKDYKISCNECYVNVRRIDRSATAVESVDIASLKLPSPPATGAVSQVMRDGKLVFSLPKTAFKPLVVSSQ
ncbi:MAG: Hsp20/alpha crystallin family protein [Verrucomicrobiales bacterium]|nr:Hsp20/alpha crystallin family protein [Verrucomicrobiales bacterium]